MDSKLDTMKKENEALWREVITLRQKHSNQQKIVNKLIHFLMSYLQTRVHPSNAVKRRYQQPLAIESRGPKETRYDKGAASTSTDGKSNDGPIIFDVTNTDDLFSNTDLNIITSPLVKPATVDSHKVEIPMSPLKQAMQVVDPCLVNPAISINDSASNSSNMSSLISSLSSNNSLVSSTPSGRPKLQREISKEDFDVETMLMQKEIDNLKDILSGQITLDSNIISNLFNPNEPLIIGSPGKDNAGGQLSLQLENPDSHQLIGTDDDEQPTLFELADIDDNDEALMPPPQIGQSSADNYPNLDTPLLETPLLTDDTLDVNPLLAQITKKGRKGKNL